MTGYALWVSLAAIALGGGESRENQKTGVVQLAAEAAGPDGAEPSAISPPGDPQTHLDLTVTEIDVRVAPDNEAPDLSRGGAADVDDSLSGEEGAGSWVRIPVEHHLGLSPGSNEVTLGAARVPAGRITQIRVVIGGEVVLWSGPGQTVVACPSHTGSNIRLAVDNDVIVPAGGTITLKLVFDLGQPALRTGEGLKLGPLVHVETSAQ